MSISQKNEELTIHFYRVDRCGYYARRQQVPVCGTLLEIIPEIHDWISQRKPRIADTATYERDVRGTYLPSYCVDSHHHGSNADRLITLWIETEVTEDNSFASVSGNSLVGNPKVKKEPLGPSDIPGIPAYFWIMPAANLIATVRFHKQQMHISDLRRYLKGYLETHYSGVLKNSSSANNHIITGIHNSNGTPLSQLDARVELKRVEVNTDIQEILSRCNSIRRIIRKKKIKLADSKDRSLLKFARKVLGLEPAVYPEEVDSSLRFKLELEQRPSREELQQMIDNFEIEDGWSDLGFAMSDSDHYIRWLSGAYSKETLNIPIARKPDGLVSLQHLMAALLERRSELLSSLNRQLSHAQTPTESETSISTPPSPSRDEDAIVTITRSGRIRRQALSNFTQTQDDDALAFLFGSTRENIILLTNRGSAYSVCVKTVPESEGSSALIQEFLKLRENERVIAATGTDPRIMAEFGHLKPNLGEEYEDPYPHMIAVTKRGMALRFTLWPHKDPSTIRGRMFGKLREGDEFVAVFKVYAEDDVAAVSRHGRLLVTNTQNIPLLAGPGIGVTLIKIADNDEVIEATQSSAVIEFENRLGRRQTVAGKSYTAMPRGGKGIEIWKSGSLKRLVYPTLNLPKLGSPPENEAE